MPGQLYPYPRAHERFQIPELVLQHGLEVFPVFSTTLSQPKYLAISLIEDHQAPRVQVRQDPSEVQLDEAVI